VNPTLQFFSYASSLRSSSSHLLNSFVHDTGWNGIAYGLLSLLPLIMNLSDGLFLYLFILSTLLFLNCVMNRYFWLFYGPVIGDGVSKILIGCVSSTGRETIPATFPTYLSAILSFFDQSNYLSLCCYQLFPFISPFVLLKRSLSDVVNNGSRDLEVNLT